MGDTMFGGAGCRPSFHTPAPLHDDPVAATSLETTHGLIRVTCDALFLFVSGIVNRVGFAGTEMVPRKYAQNFVGAHNARVVLARLLAGFDQTLT
jgi:hypothetical protein